MIIHDQSVTQCVVEKHQYDCDYCSDIDSTSMLWLYEYEFKCALNGFYTLKYAYVFQSYRLEFMFYYYA